MATTSDLGAALIATFKSNVRSRLNYLGVTAGGAARATDHHGSWLSDLLGGGRYRERLSLHIVADVAHSLGCPADRMLSKDFKAYLYARPKWAPTPEEAARA